jgi:energy-coupling factor transporter ATP-binding protein EcfA2
MEGQGVTASAASQAGQNGEPAQGAVEAAEFDDPAVSRVTSDDSGDDEGKRWNGDDTVVIPAFGSVQSLPQAQEPQPPGSGEPWAQAQENQAPGSEEPWAAGDPAPGEPASPPGKASRVGKASRTGKAQRTDKDHLTGKAPQADAAPAADRDPGPEPVAEAPPADQPDRRDQSDQPDQPDQPEATVPAGSHVRLDARLLEAALLNLRKRIAAIPLVFEIAGSAEVKAERAKLLSQIDDYLLPRVRQSAAPILVALVGSTGAGKSTLINSIVGAHVSATGVRRPTTNSPVLACHPDDIDWFAENNFLPTLPRVRQEGLARPGRDGLLVLAASEGMPRGIALLDTPDIDSVVKAHHEFAYQFLDASDLWLFMTSASRYADGPVWEILQHARDRKASLGVVLSRIPQTYRTELVDHFSAMLDANGIAAENRFVILETPLINGMLPPDAYQPVRDWLADTAARSDRRVAVLSQTMSGVLDTFKSRVPAVAAHVEAQVVLRTELRRAAEACYDRALTEASTGLRNGALLTGEVLARWQDCMVGGDLRLRRGVKAGKPAKTGARKAKRARRGPSHNAALGTALRSAIESFIVSIADRAAEHVDDGWHGNPAGAALLADAAANRARGEYVKQIFESAFGPDTGPWPGVDVDAAVAAEASQASVFGRSSPDLPLRTARAVGAWQDHLPQVVEAADQRTGARRVGFDDEALGLVVLAAVLGEDAPGTVPAVGSGAVQAAGPTAGVPAAGDEGTSIYTEPRRLLTSVYGAGLVAGILARARADLTHRIRLLLDEEMVRFVEVIEWAGPCDDVAAIRLYQAEYSLEAVR